MTGPTQNRPRFAICITGGAGAGKNSLIEDLIFVFEGRPESISVLHTSWAYRLFSWAAIRLCGSEIAARKEFCTPSSALRLARDYGLRLENGQPKGEVNGHSATTDELESPEVGRLTPFFSGIPAIRDFCNKQFVSHIQHCQDGLIIDGRDNATVLDLAGVDPAICLHVELRVNAAVAAQRRGIAEMEIKNRNREDAAITKIPDGSFVIDTSGLTRQWVLVLAWSYLLPRLPTPINQPA